MSRFGRIRRRPDHWASSHERARVRASERLDGPLGLTESAWLDEHLAGCGACAAIAAAYEQDRAALRAMRAADPVPPRDLWARTAAVIERESSASGRSPRGAALQGRRIPLGVLSGLAVVAVVVGASVLSGGLLQRGAIVDPSTATATDAIGESALPRSTLAPLPTPFAVGAGDVQWIRTGTDGTFAYNAAPIDQVCPADARSGCAALEDTAARRLLLESTPQTIIGSPTDQRAIVVSEDAMGSQVVTVVDLPAPDEPTPTGPPPATPTPTPSDPVKITPEPTNPTTDPTTEPTTDPTTEPTTDPTALSTTDPTTEPTTDPTAEPTPSFSPEPTVATTLALASDIQVVGPSAGFSVDGTWFAFTARPADRSAGPDVFVWNVGDREVQQVTSDGRSTFASWAGARLLISRTGETDGTGGPVLPLTVSVDPISGGEIPVSDAWRPVVDPTGRWVVSWEGDLLVDGDGNVAPGEGALVLRAWSDPTAPGDPVGPVTDGAGTTLDIAAPFADFDVRWDETGTWFAAWASDAVDPTLGRLSLFHLDPATGSLGQPSGAPIDVQSLPGFSIGEGRLAWATPPGQGGEGSRVQIVAWAAGGVGTVETAPGEDLIVVR